MAKKIRKVSRKATKKVAENFDDHDLHAKVAKEGMGAQLMGASTRNLNAAGPGKSNFNMHPIQEAFMREGDDDPFFSPVPILDKLSWRVDFDTFEEQLKKIETLKSAKMYLHYARNTIRELSNRYEQIQNAHQVMCNSYKELNVKKSERAFDAKVDLVKQIAQAFGSINQLIGELGGISR